ncbi:unnamed protein product [Amoebophrya sp. A120]|nr:unnamed protein product [Amoebophrya sp. A120]|eukprot:GSA120T00012266001.1
MKMGVYVDDNTATGPDEHELRHEVSLILKEFPGKIIEPEHQPNGDLLYDQLGADVHYNPNKYKVRICMQSYIRTKLAPKFGMVGCKKVDNPCFTESALYDTASPEVKFPLREAVGALQWCVTICRPDIAQPVNCLAKVASKPCTKAIVACVKKVLRYVIHTEDVGIDYSPENEQKFKQVYGSLLQKGEKLKDWNLFTDASFASCFVTLKSTSGALLYYRGAPIVWKTARQSVRTHSTFEAEFVAGSDGLIMSETCTFKGFLEDRDASEDLWMDNQTAITVAKTPGDAQRPRSRHVALRYHKVADECEKIKFCPTEHMKADCLTKNNVPRDVRDHVFHHNPHMTNKRKVKVSEDPEEVDACFTVVGVPGLFFSLEDLWA